MLETEIVVEAARRQEQLLEDLRTLVETESPSDDLDAVRISGEAVRALIERRLAPSTVELLDVDGRTHLRVRWGAGERRVLLLAHHDTVWPIGTLQRLPWSLQDGIIRGPGCFDMKLGLVQAIHALAILRGREETDLDGVTLLVTGDEEVGSPASRELIEAEAQGCRAALVMEPSADGGAFKVARKGVSQYTVRLTGRAAHAGLEPEKGVNAALELAHQVIAIAELGDEQTGTSVTPTVLRGGSSTNTVPGAASASIDVRAWTADEQLRVDAALRALRPRLPDATIQIEGGINRPPLEQARSEALYERAQALAARVGLPEPRSAAVGGASDGNFTAGLGVPTLDGLGAVGGGAHADTEHARVDQIADRVALTALLVADIVSGGEWR